MKYLRFRSAAV